MKQTLPEMMTPESLRNLLDTYQAEMEKEREGKADPQRSLLLDVEYYHKDGHTVWMENKIGAIRDDAGNIVGIHGVSRDITERKRAKDELMKSEAKLLAVLDATPFPVALVDTQDNIINFWSRSAHTLFGHTALTTDQWYQVAYPDPDYRNKVIDRWKPFLEKARQSHQAVNTGEYRVTCRDGSIRICELYAAFLADSLVVTLNDITDRKQAEEALRQERDKAQKYLDIAGVIFVILNARGEVTLINQKGSEILGYEQEDIVGKNWFDTFLPVSTKDQVRTVFNRLVAGEIEPVEYYENPVLTKGGEERIIAWHNTALKDDEGSIIGILGSGEDITEYKKAEEERKKLEKQFNQAQKMEAIGTLAGGIAHDFNNLLMSMQGNTSMMMEDLDPSHPHNEYLKSIGGQIRSAANLTKQLLGFAREGLCDVKPTDINEIVEKTAFMFGRTKKEIRIQRKYGENLWPVEADADQMERVLVNLFVNAWQAMPAGGGLFLETQNVVLDETYVKPYMTVPGRYVKDILKKRYAKGEISKEDYDRMKEELKG